MARKWTKTKRKEKQKNKNWFLTANLPSWQSFKDENILAEYRRKTYDQKNVRNISNLAENIHHMFEYKYDDTFYGKVESLKKKQILLSHKSTHEKSSELKKFLHHINEEIALVTRTLAEIHAIQRNYCGNLVVKKSMKNNAVYPLLLEFGSSLPVWIGGVNETAPPMCGSFPPRADYVIQPGQYIAAFVIPVDHHNTDMDIHDEFGIAGTWILSRVLESFEKEKYLIIDIDEVNKPFFFVHRRRIIPLPLYRANPETNPEAIFPVGAIVLALYVNTTSFFPAVVLDVPKNLQDTYTVVFKDVLYQLNHGPVMHVQQRYVIQFKEALSTYSDKDKRSLIKTYGGKAVLKSALS